MEPNFRLSEAIVLAGGKSTRMGEDKALLPIGGRSLLAKLTMELRALGLQVTVAAGSEERAEAYRGELSALDIEGGRIRFVNDAYPDCGPMAGLHAALTANLNGGDAGYAFVIACDMPNLSAAYVARLAAQIGSANEEAAAFVGALRQPFHALYHTRALPALVAHLSAGRYRMMGLLDDLQCIFVEPQGASEEAAFINVNTPGAYRRFLASEIEGT
ncbi:molybdenum cofactor guanylyltransferase [Paenibacillus sp. MMS18-CY102]|uniref:molybdenum cofactor guanylyltransferase n=1 Tax=Paenibacillus sp. MMS18-CY102 TaxID=2682849 RepID=UPI00136520F4|nr:molybdenum cofactor guanylyltransferase [Paenibacillus sp. MMS18-CY102]MWC27322.1 NTP transferase domain-containing protein [Paenibacillus sp. MMS18-CY102]